MLLENKKKASVENDRVASDKEMGIFHRVPPREEKRHFIIGMSCICSPTLEILDESTVIVDHKPIPVQM
jgi:hypothetical protein